MLVLEHRQHLDWYRAGYWSSWEPLSWDVQPEDVDALLDKWRAINTYCVSVGGNHSEYQIMPWTDAEVHAHLAANQHNAHGIKYY